MQFSAFRILLLAFFCFLISSGAQINSASAFPGNTTGWCTTQGPGTSACFGSPLAACQAQHAYYAPETEFYGYKDYDETNKHCDWQALFGSALPSLVSIGCADFFAYYMLPGAGVCVLRLRTH